MIPTIESFLFSTFQIFNTLNQISLFVVSSNVSEKLQEINSVMDWGFFSNSFNTDFKSWKARFDEARSKKSLKYLLPLAPDCSWLATAFNREPLQEIVLMTRKCMPSRKCMPPGLCMVQ